MQTLDRLRQNAAEMALRQLKEEVLPALERVIAGTPTGPVRDSLTSANIILHLVADGKPIDTNAVIGAALKTHEPQ